MIYQHIKGIRPISLEAAKAYARGFRCSLAEISPRLAQEIAGAAEFSDKRPTDSDAVTSQVRPFAWPFKSISQERYDQLTQKQKDAIEEWIDDQINRYTGNTPNHKSTGTRAKRSA